MVQFTADTRIRRRRCPGPVEHLSSGRRLRFDSKEELVPVLGRLIDALQPPEGE